jgi:hypothetical protein
MIIAREADLGPLIIQERCGLARRFIRNVRNIEDLRFLKQLDGHGI